MAIKEEIKIIVKNEIGNTDSRIDYIDVIKKLRNEDFVKKKDILNSMINYMNLMETKINELLEVGLITSINYSTLKESSNQYQYFFEEVEKESKEVGELLDRSDYPKLIKLDNNNKYIKMLERHEQEINTLT